LESACRIGVSTPILLKLLGPPCAVLLRLCAVLGTAMPEAAVDEHGDARSRKSDVGAPAAALERGKVDAEPQSHSVERGAKLEFDRCIPTPRRDHPRARGF
jgi:hypothetical protein